MNYFKYTNKEIEYLKNRDPLLGAEISRIGFIKRKINPDLFEALISSIISQQISIKAAKTVYNKVINLVGEIKPQNIDRVDVEAIQKCGMSLRKAYYIKNIADAIVNKEIDFDNLYKLSDEDIIKKLVKLKGVGEWTVEMLLIHSLQRPDILSYKDLAIRRGMMRLYGLDEITSEVFKKYRDLYSPYSTTASLYLWEIASD